MDYKEFVEELVKEIGKETGHYYSSGNYDCCGRVHQLLRQSSGN